MKINCNVIKDILIYGDGHGYRRGLTLPRLVFGPYLLIAIILIISIPIYFVLLFTIDFFKNIKYKLNIEKES